MKFSIGLVVACIVFLLTASTETFIHESSSDRDKTVIHTVPQVAETIPLTLLFVGDVMLARGIEVYMDWYGVEYPFTHINDVLQKSDITIANFEGVVSQQHVRAPGGTFQFSVLDTHLKLLKDKGVDIVSLANNHSTDYGNDAILHTRSLCAEFSIVCVGDALNQPGLMSYATTVGNTRIGFMALHDTWNEYSSESVLNELRTLVSETDVTFAYIHWGDEYMLMHNNVQQEIAYALIESGADAIIGHHPHVVQDIEVYKNKPIFYSLGNFIFDQSFSKDVMEMIGVAVEISSDNVRYTIVPFSSSEAPGQPRLLSEEVSSTLIDRITVQIASSPFYDPTTRSITVLRNDPRHDN